MECKGKPDKGRQSKRKEGTPQRGQGQRCEAATRCGQTKRQQTFHASRLSLSMPKTRWPDQRCDLPLRNCLLKWHFGWKCHSGLVFFRGFW